MTDNGTTASIYGNIIVIIELLYFKIIQTDWMAQRIIKYGWHNRVSPTLKEMILFKKLDTILFWINLRIVRASVHAYIVWFQFVLLVNL